MEASVQKRGLYMEMEQNAQIAAKRLWKIARIVFSVLKTGKVKSMFMLDLNLMLKRGNKAITNLRRRSSSTGGAEVNSSTRVHDYDPFAFICKRKRRVHGSYDNDDDAIEATAKKVFELLGEDDTKRVATAALIESPLMSPAARQTRVTDSPFLSEDGGDHDHVVDKAAEEFINKFYKNLKLQKKMANTLESAYHDGLVQLSER